MYVLESCFVFISQLSENVVLESIHTEDTTDSQVTFCLDGSKRSCVQCVVFSPPL
jgi:hypothetical protein